MFQLPFFLERSLRHSSSSFRLFSTSSFNEDTVVSLPFTTSTKFLGDKINCLPHEIKSTSKIFYCSKRILREPLEKHSVYRYVLYLVYRYLLPNGAKVLNSYFSARCPFKRNFPEEDVTF